MFSYVMGNRQLKEKEEEKKTSMFQKANSNIKAIIRQKRPIASDKAKPKMAQEKSCCFKLGFLAQATTSEPNTVPIPKQKINKNQILNSNQNVN